MASRTTSSHALLFHLLAAASVCSCGLALLVTQVEATAATTLAQPGTGAPATPAAALASRLVPELEARRDTSPLPAQRISARGREPGELSECC